MSEKIEEYLHWYLLLSMDLPIYGASQLGLKAQNNDFNFSHISKNMHSGPLFQTSIYTVIHQPYFVAAVAE